MKIPKELEMNWERAMNYGIDWTKKYFESTGLRTGIIGMSGGSDSALTAYITSKAIGGKNVTGLMMPEDSVTPYEDDRDAEDLIGSLGMRRKYINITRLVEKFVEDDPELLDVKNRIAYANIKARVRMTLLYKEANKNRGIVVGTDDRSENILGYFTKYGDGGVDVNIPEYLYKTQVRKMLEYISEKENIPAMKRIADKRPSPRLWKDQIAEEELALDYETVDLALYWLKDSGLGLSDGEIASKLDVDERIIRKIKRRETESEHKRIIPPSPQIVQFKYV